MYSVGANIIKLATMLKMPTTHSSCLNRKSQNRSPFWGGAVTVETSLAASAGKSFAAFVAAVMR
jgi:hypothetical protein